MKKTLLVLTFLFAAAAPLRAQKAGDLGAGVVIGNPTGVTGKLWIDGTRAVDAGVGFSTHLAVYGDYLWHSWTVLPQPAQGKMPVYLGLGAQVRTLHDAEFGIRTVAGIAYWLPNNPVEIFLEIVPVFRLTPGTSVGMDAGLGLRYYFGH
ncbi:MAG: hypothetical protein ACHQ51_04425 [Elusimicrobiota bacterium]